MLPGLSVNPKKTALAHMPFDDFEVQPNIFSRPKDNSIYTNAGMALRYVTDAACMQQTHTHNIHHIAPM